MFEQKRKLAGVICLVSDMDKEGIDMFDLYKGREDVEQAFSWRVWEKRDSQTRFLSRKYCLSFQRSQKLLKRVEESTSLRFLREQNGCVHYSLRFYLWVNLRSYGILKKAPSSPLRFEFRGIPFIAWEFYDEVFFIMKITSSKPSSQLVHI